jgi:hypothetical protein
MLSGNASLREAGILTLTRLSITRLSISINRPTDIILSPMNLIRRTLDIDADTDARLREMADERGQDVAAVLAEAVALLDSVVDIAGPDIGEERRRLDAFKKTRAAVPLDDGKTGVASWGSANERPRPAPLPK